MNIDELTQEVDATDGSIPMICKVNREQLLFIVNENFDREHQIPDSAEITVKVPDIRRGEDLLISHDVVIEIRWRGTP